MVAEDRVNGRVKCAYIGYTYWRVGFFDGGGGGEGGRGQGRHEGRCV